MLTQPQFENGGRVRVSPNNPERAERRRRAMQAFMNEHDLTPTEFSRKAGLPTPNAIYNFLHGRTAQLSQETLEKLAAAVPGASVDALTGSRPTRPAGARGIPIRAEAIAGVMRDCFDMPLAMQREVLMPVKAEEKAAGAFAMTVCHPGMDLIWPNGTVVVCLPMDRYTGSLTNGRKVVLQRQRGQGVEVTIRDLVVKNGQAHLWLRSEDPKCQTPVEMPWPHAGAPWKRGEDVYTLLAVVTMACVPEG